MLLTSFFYIKLKTLANYTQSFFLVTILKNWYPSLIFQLFFCLISLDMRNPLLCMRVLQKLCFILPLHEYCCHYCKIFFLFVVFPPLYAFIDGPRAKSERVNQILRRSRGSPCRREKTFQTDSFFPAYPGALYAI